MGTGLRDGNATRKIYVSGEEVIKWEMRQERGFRREIYERVSRQGLLDEDKATCKI